MKNKKRSGYYKASFEGEIILGKTKDMIKFIGRYMAMELYDKIINNDTQKLKQLELKN